MSQTETLDQARFLSLRRRLLQWRVFALVALAVAALSFFGVSVFSQDHVARVEVAGIIFADQPRHNLLRALAENDDVHAVIVHINSPGGTITGSEDIYEDLRALAEAKPVIAVMDEVAASGGYITALGADHILARQTTITGSIGVIFQWVEVSELAKKIGLKPHTLRSGDLKAQPDIFTPPSKKTLRVERELVKEAFNWFVDLVAARRNLNRADLVKIVGDGRVFSGTKAVGHRLIDGIGGLAEARDWLAREHNIASDLPLIDHQPEYPDEGVLGWVLSGDGGGGGGGGGALGKVLKIAGIDLLAIAQDKQVSGLLALWRP